jgi:Ca-activated chloride channel family protein
MNDFKLSADDPRLTAYALGELEGAERAEVEKALQNDPAAQAIVEEIRRTAAQLQAAFAEEKEEPVTPIKATKTAATDPYARKNTSRLLQFPQVYYVVGTLAAACFAVLLALHTPAPSGKGKVVREAQEKRLITTLDLPSLPEPASAGGANSAVGQSMKENDQAKPEANFSEVAADLLDKAKQTPPGAAPGTPKVEAFGVPVPATSIDGAGLAFKESSYIDALAARRQKEAALRMQAKARESSEKKELQYAASAAGRLTGYPRDEKLAETQTEPRAEAGSDLRLRTELRDVASSVSVTTSQFLRDTGATNDAALLKYTGNTEVARIVGNFAGANTETYAYHKDSDFVRAADNPLSTFSIDVDTASYANVRRFIQNGQRPPPDAVRVEELLNYFPYRYVGPESKRDDGVAATGEGAPFAASMETADAPWAPTHRLVRIGLKGREVAATQRGAANLVFLLDVSGSMDESNKLPLVKDAMKLLISRLRDDDRVAIVTYAGTTGLALPSTPVAKASQIMETINALTAGGSTNGGMGLELAYDIAKANFISDGINRVILCTDGDFNLGVTNPGDLVRLITEKAKSGVFLTALGFGMGNLKDATLQQLADAGNGNYGYIDQRREAEKLLVEQVSGTLVTIAKDVKIQVEFNPAKVAAYRLIGYEKRLLQKEDFNNDTVDAGEIGAGHTVTALYEIVPMGAGGEKESKAPSVDELRYAAKEKRLKPEISNALASELLTVKLRYKEPAGQVSRKLEFPLVDRGLRFSEASADFKFASAVAAFGMILRDSPYKGNATLADVALWAEAGASPDPGGYRAEFLSVVRQAKAVMEEAKRRPGCF